MVAIDRFYNNKNPFQQIKFLMLSDSCHIFLKMESCRFGNVSVENIRKNAEKTIPENTTKTKKYIWTQFEKFCETRQYILTN